MLLRGEHLSEAISPAEPKMREQQRECQDQDPGPPLSGPEEIDFRQRAVERERYFNQWHDLCEAL